MNYQMSVGKRFGKDTERAICEVCMEIWKDIKGFEGIYQVSNMGNVRSLDRTVHYKNGRKRFYKGQILAPHIETLGYLSVCLLKNSKRTYVRIHRLVADAFMTNNHQKPEVNHIDGNKKNNAVSNLEYATHSENMQHAVKNGLKKRVRPVQMIDKQTGRVIKIFPSQNSAAMYLGVYSSSNIRNCVNGIVKEAHGYKWESVDKLKFVETRAKDGERNR